MFFCKRDLTVMIRNESMLNQTDRQILFIGLLNITVITIKDDDEGDSIKAHKSLSFEPPYYFYNIFIIAIINDRKKLSM